MWFLLAGLIAPEANAIDDKIVDVSLSGVALDVVARDAVSAELALGELYERRLIGWAGERSNYSYNCINETWWKETLKRDASIPGEYERERDFMTSLDDEVDFIPVAHPPPHHPPPHPHPHHPFRQEEDDDFTPVAHPPPHHPPPHPHHPHPHHPWRQAVDDEDDFTPVAHPPPHHPHPHPHHPHPHHPWRQAVDDEEDDFTPVAHPPPHHPHPHPHHPHPHHPWRQAVDDEDDFTPVAHPPPHHPPPHPCATNHSLPSAEHNTSQAPASSVSPNRRGRRLHARRSPSAAPASSSPPPHRKLEVEKDLELEWKGCCEPDGYGELSRSSVEKLFETLGITQSSPTGAFFDLGSGVGKIVMHAAIAGFAKEAVGVELNDGRHRAALALLESVKDKDAVAAEAITFINANMLDVDLSKATVLYLNHACFPADMRDQITEKILDTAHNVEIIVAAPTIPRLVTSGRFAADRGFLTLGMEIYTYGTPLKIYRRIVNALA